MNGSIKSKKIIVEIQENGIIRKDIDKQLIARLNLNIKYEEIEEMLEINELKSIFKKIQIIAINGFKGRIIYRNHFNQILEYCAEVLKE